MIAWRKSYGGNVASADHRCLQVVNEQISRPGVSIALVMPSNLEGPSCESQTTVHETPAHKRNTGTHTSFRKGVRTVHKVIPGGNFYKEKTITNINLRQCANQQGHTQVNETRNGRVNTELRGDTNVCPSSCVGPTSLVRER